MVQKTSKTKDANGVEIKAQRGNKEERVEEVGKIIKDNSKQGETQMLAEDEKHMVQEAERKTHFLATLITEHTLAS